MASVFKCTYLTPIPEGAQRCLAKGVPSVRYTDGKGRVQARPVHLDGAGKETGKMVCEQHTWWMKYTLPDGTIRREKGFRDKLATEQEAARREREAIQASAGVILVDTKILYGPIEQHFDEYRDSLSRQGKARRYYRLVHQRLTRCAKDCGWKTLRQIAPADMERFLALLASEGLAAKTINEFLGAMKSFIRWCIRTRRLAANSLEGLQNTDNPKNADNDKAALTPEQAKTLLAFAGPNRLVYFVALRTGLRRKELESLQWGDVHVEELRPYILLRAKATKAKRADTVPLRSDVAEELKAARPADASPLDPVFEYIPRMRVMWADFKAAGIPENDDYGKVYCFHSLRVTFGTWLAQAGTAPRVHMELMRHTDMKLTMRYYTDPRLLDTSGAVQNLPELKGRGEAAEKVVLRRTGTDDVGAENGHIEDGLPTALNRVFSCPDGGGQGGTEGSEENENPTGASANGVHENLMARATGLEPATFGSTIQEAARNMLCRKGLCGLLWAKTRSTSG
jgi:integrase